MATSSPQEEFRDDARLPVDVLDEQFERAQRFVARHVRDFDSDRHDLLQVPAKTPRRCSVLLMPHVSLLQLFLLCVTNNTSQEAAFEPQAVHSEHSAVP